MKVFPGSDLNTLDTYGHPVHKAVEAEFDYWVKNQPTWRSQPYRGWGEDEPAVCNKSGAITDAIEAMIEEADYSQKPITISSFDLYAIFQP